MTITRSLSTLVGEWVAFHKSPDAKISTQSAQDIKKAVAEEKRTYSLRVKKIAEPSRRRCVSVNLPSESSEEPRMRAINRARRPSSFIGLIKWPFTHSKEEIDAIEEEDIEQVLINGEKGTSALRITIY